MSRVVRQVIIGQAPHLLGGRFNQSFLAIADRQAPQARHAFDIFFAVDVGDPDTVAFLYHQPSLFQVGLQIGQWMDQRRGIACLG